MSQTIPARLTQVRHVALDMDGTIYQGGTLFDFTVPFLAALTDLGIGYTFLTNNPSKSRTDYLAHLHKLGVPAEPDQLYTSTQATIEFIQQRHPTVRRLFALGTASMGAEFVAAGFELVPESPEAEPDAVLVGFDLTLTYARLCRAAWWISRGKPWFGTNPDRVCPTDQPTVLVDCGSLCAALTHATGRQPTAVLGKPDPAMLRGILQQHQLQPGQLAMVGDRLYTDVEMARRAGAVGVLVLTGETRRDDLATATSQPDVVVPSLVELGEMLRAARQPKAKP